ncbi:MAG: sulfite exporter TauE/SafE family protein [Alphaproteobacteria bacterium]|nr:sulfite exporter TauE/SafE family protein [Alphaproteobacteria bacterium]
MSSLALAAVILPTAVAIAFLSGVFGMAGGLVLMGVLLLVLPVPQAMVLHGMIQTVSNGWRAIVWWRYIKFRMLPPYIAGTLSIAGVLALVRFVPDKSICYVLMGLLPAIAMLMPNHRVPSMKNPVAAFGGGALQSGLQLTAGAAGPIVDAMYLSAGLDRREVVATKAAAVTWSHLTKAVYYGTIWQLTGPDDQDLPLWLYGAAILMAMLGTTLARGVLERMNNESFIRYSRWLIMGISVVYLTRGIVGLIGMGGVEP